MKATITVAAWTIAACAMTGNGLLAATAQYQVVFDSTWSQATHPNAWISSAHYSGLVGATHNSNVTFWQLGGLATQGIKDMAEKGAQSTLAAEVNAVIATGNASSVILGPATGLRPSPGTTSATFQIDTAHPLVTLVTMVAPSPDWFVGVDGLPLFENNQWRDNVVVEMLPYDAGTDSGVTFNSADLATTPPAPIALLGAPFVGTPPLGTFTFHLLPGAGDVNADGYVDIFDINLVSQHWGTSGPAGDANGDQMVDIFDINLVSSNWSPPVGGATAVPEPAALASAAAAALMMAVAAGMRLTHRAEINWSIFSHG